MDGAVQLIRLENKQASSSYLHAELAQAVFFIFFFIFYFFFSSFDPRGALCRQCHTELAPDTKSSLFVA